MTFPVQATFPAFIAIRYLRPRKGRGLISIVSALAVGGFAAGVGALILALAVTNGFQEVLQQELVGATAQVNLLLTGQGAIRDYRPLLERMARLPHVAAVAPAVYDQVLITHGGRSKGAFLKGVEPAEELRVGDLLNHVEEGSWHPLQERPGDRNLVLGSDLAAELGAAPGDFVSVYVPDSVLTPLGMSGASVEFKVAGLVHTGFGDFDSLWGYTGLTAAQELHPGSGTDWASDIEFKVDNIYRADEVAAEAQKAAGAGFTATTWITQNRPIFQALHIERLCTLVVISLVVLVAALNVLIMLAMLVLEKRREIAVLIGMGARQEQIRQIFVLQGLLIAAMGIVAGLATAYPLAWAANRFHWIPVSQEVYSVSYIPFHAHALDGALVAALTLAISYLATLYPSRRAMAVAPAETLRYE